MGNTVCRRNSLNLLPTKTRESVPNTLSTPGDVSVRSGILSQNRLVNVEAQWTARTSEVGNPLRKFAIINTSGILEDYAFETAGLGYQPHVRVAIHKATGQRRAVRKFKKSIETPDQLSMVRNEVYVYLHLDHPNIARLTGIHEDALSIYLITELCSGGELYDHLSKSRVYSEEAACKAIRQMLYVIQYLHSRGVVHRDLKLETWIYQSEEENALLKLVNFQFSKRWRNSAHLMRGTCGSLPYTSPEVLLGGYTESCDLWSIGIIAYTLLVGHPPTFGTEKKIIGDILNGDFAMTGPRWDKISTAAKGLVRSLLEVDPEKRIHTKDALNHPWIASFACFPRIPPGVDILRDTKRLAEQPTLKRLSYLLMAYFITTDNLGDLLNYFLALDASQEGIIQPGHVALLVQPPAELAKVERLFRALDISGVGAMTYNGFLAVMLFSHLPVDASLVFEAFMKFSLGKSVLTQDSLQEVLGNSYEDRYIREMIDELDPKRSGVIEYEEFLAAVGNQAHGVSD